MIDVAQRMQLIIDQARDAADDTYPALRGAVGALLAGLGSDPKKNVETRNKLTALHDALTSKEAFDRYYLQSS